MKRSAYPLILVAAFAILLFMASGVPGSSPSELLSLVFPETITPEALKSAYAGRRLRVLLVPGHDHEYGGTAYGKITEEQLNVEMARALYDVLKTDPHYEVTTTRDLTTREYIPELQRYLIDNREKIIKRTSELKTAFYDFVDRGELTLQEGMNHKVAATEVAIRLYGINAWANEQKIDLALHIHFNDYGGRRRGVVGPYNGFAIYVPEGQYANARASKELGLAISNALQQRLPLSDFPQESSPVTEDQSLIAIGAYGSREGGAMLLEYGYIYESQWQSKAVRDLMLPELALKTAEGMKRYFEPTAGALASKILPATISADLKKSVTPLPDVLRLQTALQREGLYPPAGETLASCPLSAVFGPCTALAVTAFQKKYSIPSTGQVDSATRAQLNSLVSS